MVFRTAVLRLPKHMRRGAEKKEKRKGMQISINWKMGESVIAARLGWAARLARAEAHDGANRISDNFHAKIKTGNIS